MRAWLEEALKNREVPFRKDVSTATLSTFRIGGVCAFVIEPRCKGELIFAIGACRHASLSYAIIGRGSNVLFDDEALPPVLIRTVGLSGVREENGRFVSDTGVSLTALARRAAQSGFADLAFAAGIPGTVGGGVYMNAGAHEKSLGELIEQVTVYHPELDKIETYFHQKLSFSYRKSVFQTNNAVILDATLHCREPREPSAILAEMQALCATRAATQPLTQPSAGSTFLRTENGTSMGKIIDELGLKGLRCGNAAVSEKHAGFIVNLGGATARDVRELIAVVQDIVEKNYGFRPRAEIRFVTENQKA
ncbi:MAG: UDP-N-acetylmuramate dehydrogenase [Clostridia bacterium]|nr:UDP-N-acetylmuramate dehydrogenase [Clostridia bacterium]